MDNNYSPNSWVVSLEESTVADRFYVICIHADHSNQASKETQLNVPHPNACRRAFQDLFKVHTSESTGEASA